MAQIVERITRKVRSVRDDILGRMASAWFDTCNQFYGVEAKPGMAFSVRVDGKFNDEFRARMPVPPYNRASTPALWACSGKKM
jgi:hypothetical protein